MAGYLAGAALAIALALPFPCLAQKGAVPHPPSSLHPPQQHTEAPPPSAERPQIGAPHQRGHAGDWLRRYKDLPPDEQERELRKDPAFQRLPRQRQQILLRRLQHFSSLPPETQLQVLNRMETWEHLTPEQKAEAWRIHAQMQQFPPNRRWMIRRAIRDLRAMPPEQREQEIDSPRFRGMFSDQERAVIREVTRLPLAPPEPGEAPPPQP